MQTPSHGICPPAPLPLAPPPPALTSPWRTDAEKRTHNKVVTYESTGEINFTRILLAAIPGDLYRPLNRGPWGPWGRYIRRVHADRRRIFPIYARKAYTSAVTSVILIAIHERDDIRGKLRLIKYRRPYEMCLCLIILLFDCTLSIVKIRISTVYAAN